MKTDWLDEATPLPKAIQIEGSFSKGGETYRNGVYTVGGEFGKTITEDHARAALHQKRAVPIED